MLFLTTLSTLFALSTLTTAAPQPPSSPSLTKRGLPGAFYICLAPNWTGDCYWHPPDSGCRIPGTGNKAPKSFGPDPGGYCILYEEMSSDCQGQEVARLKYPGRPDQLPAFGSFKCFADGTGPIIRGRPM